MLQLWNLSRNAATDQNSASIDLVFAGIATDPLKVASTSDQTLDLKFVEGVFLIADLYACWE